MSDILYEKCQRYFEALDDILFLLRGLSLLSHVVKLRKISI